MVQAVALFDAYGFGPMIRQHYAHAVFAPLRDEPASHDVAAQGLASALSVLQALEAIAAEGLVLAGPMTLTDCHLGPMLRAFALSVEGARALADCPALDRRRDELERRESLLLACPPCRD